MIFFFKGHLNRTNCLGYPHTCGPMACVRTWEHWPSTLGGSVSLRPQAALMQSSLKLMPQLSGDLSGLSTALGTVSSFMSWIKCNKMSAVKQFQQCQIGTCTVSGWNTSVDVGLLSITNSHLCFDVEVPFFPHTEYRYSKCIFAIAWIKCWREDLSGLLQGEHWFW